MSRSTGEKSGSVILRSLVVGGCQTERDLRRDEHVRYYDPHEIVLGFEWLVRKGYALCQEGVWRPSLAGRGRILRWLTKRERYEAERAAEVVARGLG